MDRVVETGSTKAAVKAERERCAVVASEMGHDDVAEIIRGYKSKAGRPAMPYDEEIALTICAAIAAGCTMEEVCSGEDMPNEDTVYRWLASTAIFSGAYARARDQQMDVWAEQIIQIADDARNDYMDRVMQNGSFERVLDAENINRSKLRIETRKWVMGRLAAKRYGDKIEIEQTVTIETIPDAELQTRIAARMARMGIILPAPVLTIGHEPPPDDDEDGDNPGTGSLADDII